MTGVLLFPKIARTLRLLGYGPIPIKRGTKQPATEGWQDGDFASRAHEFENDFTGVRTRYTPGIDLDLSDPELVRQSVDIVCDVLGCRVLDLPARVGMAPRTLLMCRTDVPFSKRSTAAYELPTDPIVDGKLKRSRVEILADGQQFVAYAIHPHTHRPYEWVTVATPMNTHEWELVTITEAQADEIIRRVEPLLAARGKRHGGSSTTDAIVQSTIDLDPLAADGLRWRGTPADVARLKSALHFIDPNGSRDDYLTVLFGCHAAGGIELVEAIARPWARGDFHGIVCEKYSERGFDRDIRGIER